jgi:hypothetical protein
MRRVSSEAGMLPPRARRRTVRRISIVAALILMLAPAAVARPALAGGGVFEVEQTVELLKREIAAVGNPGTWSRPWLRVEEMQLDLALVEIVGRGGSRLVVPAADYGTGKDGPARPALRRHLAIDLSAPRESKSAGGIEAPDRSSPPAAPSADAAPGAELPNAGLPNAGLPAAAAKDGPPAAAATDGPLARAIGDLVTAIRTGVAAEPSFDAKRIAVDLEFALQRDARGAPTVVVFAGDRQIAPKNVQKLRLKLSTKDRQGPGGA